MTHDQLAKRAYDALQRRCGPADTPWERLDMRTQEAWIDVVGMIIHREELPRDYDNQACECAKCQEAEEKRLKRAELRNSMRGDSLHSKHLRKKLGHADECTCALHVSLRKLRESRAAAGGAA